MNRRRWIKTISSVAGLRAAAAQAPAAAPRPLSLPLDEYRPKSMLHVPVTPVPRARFPVIDVHTHLTFARANARPSNRRYATPEEILAVMDRKNLRTLVHLTGGNGDGLKESLARYDQAHPGRFLTFTEPTWTRASEPGFPQFQADELGRARRAGAKGLKVLKTLGLYLRENGNGKLVKVDDARFDSMWETCAALKMPVAMHVGDPEAFFLSTDRFNERFEELNNHPDWSFHGRDFPEFREIMEARNRVFSRHPRTQFIVLHVGNNAENLGYVSECMDRFPNMHCEIGARIGELGRQPRASRKFFDRYQDRILFGTDAIPYGFETPQQIFNDALYEIYFRFLETDDEYFDYAPAPVPPQGRWAIYGIGLPEPILRKVYSGNAERLLGLLPG